MKEALKYLKSKLKKGDTIVVACSGGPDSMGLLHLIVENFKNINIICAHVNHKVRKQSDKEYKYVQRYCNNLGLTFEGTEINKELTGNFESEARKFRYEYFFELLNKYNAKYIVTAHHGDDQIETILMRITRGSNLNGYAGIKLEDKSFLRPLLKVGKKEILNYVKSNKVKYYNDVTNKSNIHTRNRYRSKVIPFLRKESSNIYKKYLKFSNELQEYDSFVSSYIQNKQLICENKVQISKLNSETDFIKRKTIELLIKEIQKKDYLDVNEKNVDNILKIINSDKCNSKINLSNEYVAKKSYDTFEILKKMVPEQYNVVFKDKCNIYDWQISNLKQSDDKSNNTIRLNSSEIKLPLIIRNRRVGDSILLNKCGTKKIKDIFIDEKVDSDLRNQYPIVTDSNNIVLWIPGLKKSKFDKEKKEKYDIILHSERKQKNE